MAHGATTTTHGKQAHYSVPQPMPWPIEGPCVSSFATPLDIIPGERFELPEGARMGN